MSTKISLVSKPDNLQQFTASNEKGQTVSMSGDGTATGPMQMLLKAVAGCSTIDVVMILEKMRQKLQQVEVEVEGIRRDEIPRIYTKIHLHYILKGDIKETKAAQAIEMSLQKYCSVSKMIDAVAEITSSFEIKS